MPSRLDFEVVCTDGWSQEERETYLNEIQQKHAEQTFFLGTLAPTPFHWHFQQASDALQAGFFLPGLSGLLNGIEASLRTVCCQMKKIPLDGDLGRVMSNPLLKEASEHGLKVETLAFPNETDFLNQITRPRDHVALVSLRNDICHGNFQAYGKNLPGIGDFFTPECLGPISATLLDVSYDWALELARFMEEQGWKNTKETLDRPNNPLADWLKQD